MADYGLTDAGFVLRPREVIRESLLAAVRGSLGQNTDLSASSPLGQPLEIGAEKYAELWEVLLAVHQGRDPDMATGAALDALCALTGTVRRGASATKAALVLTGTPLTSIPAGRLVGISGTSSQVATDATAILSAVPAWAPSTPYALGARFHATVSAVTRCYQVISPGTSHASTAPSGEGASVANNTLTCTYLGRGDGAADVGATCTATGPVIALARTISSIQTPVGGWQGVINLADGVTGADREGTATLRTRRERELASGLRTLISALSQVSRLDGVTYAAIQENTTDAVDGNGLPAHSFEVIVLGGDDAEIAQVVLDNKPEGIATYGTTTEQALDEKGNPADVSFTRPTLLPFWVDVTIEVDAEEYPDNGDDLVAAAIVAEWNRVALPGLNVRASVHMRALQSGIPGVLGVAESGFGTQLQLYQDVAPSPTSVTQIAVGVREIASLDASRVTVTSVAVTP